MFFVPVAIRFSFCFILLSVLSIKVISLLRRIVSTHHQGAEMLLETDCQCSMEVSHSVVIIIIIIVASYNSARIRYSVALIHLQNSVFLLQGMPSYI